MATHAHLSRPGILGTGPPRPLSPVATAVRLRRRSASRRPAAAVPRRYASSYGWPVKPFDRQHPRARVLRRPAHRGDAEATHSGFHFGIDIACPNGTPVYATLDGVVRLESFRTETVALVGSDGHTRVPVLAHPPGRRERPARERLPHRRRLGAGAMGARAFLRAARRRLRQPAAGRRSPVRSTDATRPSVKQLRASAGGSVISTRATRGTVELVVEAYDETPIAVPGRWGGKPVTPRSCAGA